jgi:hypothetical protein
LLLFPAVAFLVSHVFFPVRPTFAIPLDSEWAKLMQAHECPLNLPYRYGFYSKEIVYDKGILPFAQWSKKPTPIEQARMAKMRRARLLASVQVDADDYFRAFKGVAGLRLPSNPKPLVTREAPHINGTITNVDEVGKAIRRNMTAITACYGRALRRNRQLAGKMTLRLSVNTMGKVTAANIDKDSLHDPAVTTCIQNYASRWRFPPPDSGTAEIAIPLIFKAVQ